MPNASVSIKWCGFYQSGALSKQLFVNPGCHCVAVLLNPQGARGLPRMFRPAMFTSKCFQHSHAGDSQTSSEQPCLFCSFSAGGPHPGPCLVFEKPLKNVPTFEGLLDTAMGSVRGSAGPIYLPNASVPPLRGT